MVISIDIEMGPDLERWGGKSIQVSSKGSIMRYVSAPGVGDMSRRLNTKIMVWVRPYWLKE